MDKAKHEILTSALFDQCQALLKCKTADYADESNVYSNFEKVALMTNATVTEVICIFLATKIARIIELENKDKVNNESVLDSLKDIINYAALLGVYINEGQSKTEWYIA